MKTPRKIALVTILLSTLVGFTFCKKREIFKGKIVKEQFYPDSRGFLGGRKDTYTALVKLSNKSVLVNYLGKKAIGMDLKYDKGDSVDVRESIWENEKYEFVDSTNKNKLGE